MDELQLQHSFENANAAMDQTPVDHATSLTERIAAYQMPEPAFVDAAEEAELVKSFFNSPQAPLEYFKRRLGPNSVLVVNCEVRDFNSFLTQSAWTTVFSSFDLSPIEIESAINAAANEVVVSYKHSMIYRKTGEQISRAVTERTTFDAEGKIIRREQTCDEALQVKLLGLIIDASITQVVDSVSSICRIS
jgi:hypothetical protein